MKATARALVALAVLVAVLCTFLPAASGQQEPKDNYVRNAWTDLAHQIETGADYAQAVEQARIAASYANGRMACPLPEATFVDSWGAPRSGGRSHLGVDMMAPHGVPVLAPATGTYRQHGYESFYLDAVDGTRYFGTHVAGHLHPDGPVTAGTPVAVNSNTGNAAGGSPHLHLQIAPTGGEAWVNPYPATLAACTTQTPVSLIVAPEASTAVASAEAWRDPTPNRISAHDLARHHQLHGHAQWHHGRGTPRHLWRVYQYEAAALRNYLVAVERAKLRAYFAAANSSLVSRWQGVANCESGDNIHAVSPSGKYRGWLQFSRSTFNAYGGVGDPLGQSRSTQATVAERVRTQGQGLGAWPHCGQFYR